MQLAIQIHRDQDEAVAAFCIRHQVKELALFGSATRDDFAPTSDVDVLIDFLPGEVPSLFQLADMQGELSHVFGGRQVDLVMKPSLSKYLAERVLAERVVLYER